MIYPELKDRCVVVTGAGNNLGRVIARAFAAQGARVVACDIDGAAAEATCALIAGDGAAHAALPQRANVGDAESVASMVRSVLEAQGAVDIVVNCAGVTQTGRPRLADLDEALFDRLLKVNLKGPWLVMKAVIPHMARQPSGGIIVNVASVMGLVAEAGVGAYAASKHGVLALTKAAALEYGRLGIRVNAVCPSRQEGAMLNPGATEAERAARRQGEAEMNPASGRAGKPSEVAATILFLCSDGAANIQGAALPVDGGYTAR